MESSAMFSRKSSGRLLLALGSWLPRAAYFEATSSGGCQVPSPTGRIEAASAI